jgi:hypothetical protein
VKAQMDDAKPKTWNWKIWNWKTWNWKTMNWKTWNCLIRCRGRGAAHPPRVCYAASHPKLHCIAQKCHYIGVKLSGARRRAFHLVIQIDVPGILAAGRATGVTPHSPQCEG